MHTAWPRMPPRHVWHQQHLESVSAKPVLDDAKHTTGQRTSLATHASGDSNSGLDTMQDFHSSVRSMLPLISLQPRLYMNNPEAR